MTVLDLSDVVENLKIMDTNCIFLLFKRLAVNPKKKVCRNRYAKSCLTRQLTAPSNENVLFKNHSSHMHQKVSSKRARCISGLTLTISASFAVAHKICRGFLPVDRCFKHAWCSRSIFVLAVVVFVFVSFASLALAFSTAIFAAFVTFMVFFTV